MTAAVSVGPPIRSGLEPESVNASCPRRLRDLPLPRQSTWRGAASASQRHRESRRDLHPSRDATPQARTHGHLPDETGEQSGKFAAIRSYAL